MQQQNDYDDIILLSILAIVDDDSQSTFLTLFLTQTSRRLRLRKGSIDQATNRQEQKRTRERKHYAFIFLPHAHHRPSYSSLTYFFFLKVFYHRVVATTAAAINPRPPRPSGPDASCWPRFSLFLFISFSCGILLKKWRDERHDDGSSRVLTFCTTRLIQNLKMKRRGVLANESW